MRAARVSWADLPASGLLGGDLVAPRATGLYVIARAGGHQREGCQPAPATSLAEVTPVDGDDEEQAADGERGSRKPLGPGGPGPSGVGAALSDAGVGSC